jgi:hypothetical protein
VEAVPAAGLDALFADLAFRRLLAGELTGGSGRTE